MEFQWKGIVISTIQKKYFSGCSYEHRITKEITHGHESGDSEGNTKAIFGDLGHGGGLQYLIGN